MNLNQDRISSLIQKMFNHTISNDEQKELDSYINKIMESNRYELHTTDYPNEEYIRKKILANILKETNPKKTLPTRIYYFMTKYAVAVSLVLITTVTFSLYLLNRSTKISEHEIIIANSDEVFPAPSNAILKDQFGNVINLDQEKQNIIIKNNRLVYNNDVEVNLPATKTENQLLTLQTSKGGFYTLTLSDGSRVWLNANSKLEYPLSFDKKNREVVLDGEAYFDIIGDSKKPFFVKTNDQIVRVIGTEFNIKSYRSTGITKTSLVEGKIALKINDTPASLEQILLPNEQAVNQNQSINIVKKNIQADIAWKKGLFYFNGIDAKSALQDLCNWYDIDIEIQSNLNDTKFYGIIERNKPLSTLLYLMKESGLKFKIEQNNQRKKLIAY